jgi:hypothetical protein
MSDPFAAAIKGLEEFGNAPQIADVPFYVPEKKPEWLYDFSRDVCGHWKLQPQPHYEMINVVEPFLGDCLFNSSKERRAVAVLVPRGNYKSTIFGEDLSVGILTKNPNARILITSNNKRLAKQRITGVKNQFEKNETFKKAYGDDWKPQFREGVWNDESILISRRTEHFREPSVTVAAVGADITGMHFNVIIADDLVDDKNTKTKEQRDKVFEYFSTLWAILDPGGVLVVLGTHWHPDDAYVRLRKRDEKLIEKGEKPFYHWYVRGCYDGPNGLYFPEEYPHEALDSLRAENATRFSAYYLNQPIAQDDLIFKPEYLVEKDFDYYVQNGRGIVQDGNEKIPVDTVMCWDTAGTKSNVRSDYHGLTIRGTDAKKTLWTIAAEQKKGTVSEVVSRVVAHILMHRPRKLIIEAVGSYDHWREKVEERLKEYDVRVQITESHHRGIPKEERIAMLEPDWSARKWVIKPDQTELKNQIKDFSMDNKLAHDDVLDSFAMGIGEYRDPGDNIPQWNDDDDRDHEYIALLQERGAYRSKSFFTRRRR